MLFSGKKTSVRIALLFTLFASILFAAFILLLNIFYFYSWNVREGRDSYDDVIEMRTESIRKHVSGNVAEQKFIKSITLIGGTVETAAGGKYFPKETEPEPVFFGIYEKEWKWYKLFPVEIPGFSIRFPYDVSEHIGEQKNLLLISVILSLIFLAVTFGVSFVFSRSSLAGVHDVLRYIASFRMGNSPGKFPVSEPKDDEIVSIWRVLERTFSDIDRQSRIMKQLSADMAHEFRTPLMMMSSELDYMSKSGEYGTGIDRMKQHIAGLESLVRSLLTLAQIEDGQMRTEKTDISDLLGKEGETYRKKYARKGIVLKTNIQKNVFKKTNANMLRIVFANLLENAYKYTETGTITLTLTEKRCTVADTGIGIDANEQEKIWERFYRVDASRTDVTSYGVGLFLVKMIVGKLGYSISLESEKGKWSVFRIDF